MAGAYDYESICILLMLVIFHQWMLAVSKATDPVRRFLHSFVGGIVLAILAGTWGGYVYTLNLIPLHAMAVFFLQGDNLFPQYAIFYLVSESFMMLIPVIGLELPGIHRALACHGNLCLSWIVQGI